MRAIADSRTNMPHPGMEGHLSILATRKLVSGLTPHQSRAWVPSENGLVKEDRIFLTESRGHYPRNGLELVHTMVKDLEDSMIT
jgi:hypothetical protein